MPERQLPPAEPKPGIKSTEFWLTLGISGAGLLAFVGLISGAEQSQLATGMELISDGVGKIIAGAVIVLPVLKYIVHRTELKIRQALGSRLKEE